MGLFSKEDKEPKAPKQGHFGMQVDLRAAMAQMKGGDGASR